MNDTRDTAAGHAAAPASGPAPTPPPSPPSPVRRLVRSRTDRKIAGVAGGLGAYTGLDPVIFRLALVLATFFGGTGLVAYAIAWIVLPEGDTTAAPARERGDDDTSSLISLIVGGFLLLLGIATLFDLADIGFLWPVSWPVAMIAAGIAVLVWARRRDGGHPAGAPTPAPSPRPAPGSPAPRPAAPEPTAARATGGESDLLPVRFGEATDTDPDGDQAAAGAGTGGGEPWDPASPDSAADGASPSGRGRLGISATALTVAAIFLFVGIATLGHLAEWWDLAPGTVFGCTLVLCGAGLVASAWLGRGLLLIPLGIISAVGLAGSAWIDVPIRGGIGDKDELPGDATEVDAPFRLAIGRLTVDLTELDFEGAVEVEASVGIGELTVLVPDDVGVDVEARAGIGEAVMDGTDVIRRGRSEGGLGASIDRRLRSSDGGRDDLIELEARVGIGQVKIERVPASRPLADDQRSPPGSLVPSGPSGSDQPTSTTEQTFDR